jgi:hypothetical protein
MCCVLSLRADEQLASDEGAEDGEAPVSGGRSFALPHVRFDELWSNLYYSYSEKCSVLSYAETALEMALCRVPADVVNCNRIVLLHGPPGTGSCIAAHPTHASPTLFLIGCQQHG